MIKKFIDKLLGDQNQKTIKSLQPTVEKIKEIAEKYETELKDQNDVLAKTSEFKNRLKEGESLEDILPEAFALVKIACKHLVGHKWDVRGEEFQWEIQSPYDVQILGGIVIHQGNIAEMKTGEGKTLVCTMPIYLNALEEKGVFVVTVNDYLAQRDSEWMSGLYNYLGLSVGCIKHGQSQEEKKQAYACDITYGTNNEFGFDYLRDNMATKAENVVQKELNYAIVDEVDSILIDESRTPLIISAPAAESTEKYEQYSKLIPQLKEGDHYDIDEKGKRANLTENGISKLEEILGMENIYTEAGFSEVHHIEQALRAYTCYKKDIDYVVNEGQIVIIDEFTGRMMPGRRYSQGLHQAIEAKEGVEIKRESKTLATITFQNYFRMFNKLAGMTGTAETEKEEFYQIYGLDTVVIPTNKPIARQDKSDAVYKNQKGKYIAAAAKIKELHEKGQPVLVGTVSVESSELVSRFLAKENIPHEVLNAKNHEREAEIVAQAGQKGAVTIATNMAGRGTDIKLGEGVKELGGLYVLGTERHESRRIDNQLRGRSGRQGDPGETQFFVSMEDQLMRLFGGDRMKSMMDRLNFPDDTPIENSLISRSIEGAQKKVEGRNFDIRKHLVEYDDVMNIHRDIVYKRRHAFLTKEDLSEDIFQMLDELGESIVLNHTQARPQAEWDYKEIHEAVSAIHKEADFTQAKLEEIENQKKLTETVQTYLKDNYQKRASILPEEKTMRQIERAIFLRVNDRLWMEHINTMKYLREKVAFSGYAQKNPLNEYQQEGYQLFQELTANISTSTINMLFKVDLKNVVEQLTAKPAEQKTVETRKEESTPVGAQPQKADPKPITYSTFGGSNSAKSDDDGIRVYKTNRDPQQEEPEEKVGRNEPCPCGSGKKYKKCHGKES